MTEYEPDHWVIAAYSANRQSRHLPAEGSTVADPVPLCDRETIGRGYDAVRDERKLPHKCRTVCRKCRAQAEDDITLGRGGGAGRTPADVLADHGFEPTEVSKR